MWLLAVALFLICMLIPKADKQVTVGHTRSRNFEISPESRKMFEKMQKDRMSNENLKKFLMMEDRFLEYEKDSACRAIDRRIEATKLDQLIKETFMGYDFGYHTKHLRQVAEQNRQVNPYLSCFLA